MIPTAPPNRLETWINTLSNDQLAALFLGVCVFAFAVGMAVSMARIVGRSRRVEAPVRTVAVSSSRKSGRVSSR